MPWRLKRPSETAMTKSFDFVFTVSDGLWYAINSALYITDIEAKIMELVERAAVADADDDAVGQFLF